jgi:hypothetical protein
MAALATPVAPIPPKTTTTAPSSAALRSCRSRALRIGAVVVVVLRMFEGAIGVGISWDGGGYLSISRYRESRCGNRWATDCYAAQRK